MKEQIFSLLANGVQQSAVAAAVGVSEGYVSQLANSEEYQVFAAKRQVDPQLEQHDKKIADLEEIALAKVHKLMEFETNIMRALKVFQVANAAHRRSQQAPTPDQGAVVSITLPKAMEMHLKLTTDKQVVEINGRSMNTMQSRDVKARLEAKRQATQQLVTDVTPVISKKVVNELAKF
jgi:hypothetical protein